LVYLILVGVPLKSDSRTLVFASSEEGSCYSNVPPRRHSGRGTLSIGKSWCAIGKNRCWEAVRPAKEQFSQVLEPIRNFLSSQHEQLSKGISVRKALLLDIYMTGPTAEQAGPTIIFTCENKTQPQSAQKLVRNSKLLDQYPGFRLGESIKFLKILQKLYIFNILLS